MDSTTPPTPTPTLPVTNPSPPYPLNTTKQIPKGFGLFKPSLEAVKLNVWTLLGLYVLPTAYFIVILVLVSGKNSSGDNAVALILTLVGIIGSLFIYPALLVAQLKSARGEKISLMETIKTGLPFFGRLCVLALILGVVISVGLVLFIVPGIILINRYFFSPYYLIDKNLGVLESMRTSAANSKGHGGAIWSILGVYAIIGFLRFIPLIGTFVSYILQFMYSSAPAVYYTHTNKSSSPLQPTLPPVQPPVPSVQ